MKLGIPLKDEEQTDRLHKCPTCVLEERQGIPKEMKTGLFFI